MNPKPLSTGKLVGLVVLVVLIIGLLWVRSAYNSFVTLRANADAAQAEIENQYQRRFDLIPNLVETAKGIANLEQSVFTSLAEARSKYAGSVPGSSDRVSAMNDASSAFARLLVIVENYPELKSSESFLKLQDQLEGTENRISVARSNFNAVVNELNKKVNFFPGNIVARMFEFSERELFKSVEGASAPPKVDFKVL